MKASTVLSVITLAAISHVALGGDDCSEEGVELCLQTAVNKGMENFFSGEFCTSFQETTAGMTDCVDGCIGPAYTYRLFRWCEQLKGYAALLDTAFPLKEKDQCELINCNELFDYTEEDDGGSEGCLIYEILPCMTTTLATQGVQPPAGLTDLKGICKYFNGVQLTTLECQADCLNEEMYNTLIQDCEQMKKDFHPFLMVAGCEIDCDGLEENPSEEDGDVCSVAGAKACMQQVLLNTPLNPEWIEGNFEDTACDFAKDVSGGFANCVNSCIGEKGIESLRGVCNSAVATLGGVGCVGNINCDEILPIAEDEPEPTGCVVPNIPTCLMESVTDIQVPTNGEELCQLINNIEDNALDCVDDCLEEKYLDAINQQCNILATSLVALLSDYFDVDCQLNCGKIRNMVANKIRSNSGVDVCTSDGAVACMKNAVESNPLQFWGITLNKVCTWASETSAAVTDCVDGCIGASGTYRMWRLCNSFNGFLGLPIPNVENPCGINCDALFDYDGEDGEGCLIHRVPECMQLEMAKKGLQPPTGLTDFQGMCSFVNGVQDIMLGCSGTCLGDEDRQVFIDDCENLNEQFGLAFRIVGCQLDCGALAEEASNKGDVCTIEGSKRCMIKAVTDAKNPSIFELLDPEQRTEAVCNWKNEIQREVVDCVDSCIGEEGVSKLRDFCNTIDSSLALASGGKERPCPIDCDAVFNLQDEEADPTGCIPADIPACLTAAATGGPYPTELTSGAICQYVNEIEDRAVDCVSSCLSEQYLDMIEEQCRNVATALAGMLGVIDVECNLDCGKVRTMVLQAIEEGGVVLPPSTGNSNAAVATMISLAAPAVVLAF